MHRHNTLINGEMRTVFHGNNFSELIRMLCAECCDSSEPFSEIKLELFILVILTESPSAVPNKKKQFCNKHSIISFRIRFEMNL